MSNRLPSPQFDSIIALYCHLHTHSCFSFLEGLPSPVELVRAAASQGMPALALTDHGGMTGLLAFYRACQLENIQPILGLEIDIQLPYHLSVHQTPDITGRLVLLAMDLEGWRNLCRLSSNLHMSRAAENGQRCTLHQLSQFSTGLICLTGGNLGPLRLAGYQAEEGGENLLLALKDIFPGNLYIELHRLSNGDDEINERLAQVAFRLKLPIVASQPVFYLERRHETLQKTVSAIRKIVPIDKLSPDDVAPPGAFFATAHEMETRFTRHPQAIKAIAEIMERCKVDLPLGKPNYPQVPLPQGMSAIALLRQKAEEGARRIYPNPPTDLSLRMEHELSVIAARGYEPIFLIAGEMIAYAQNNGIPSASRGSASSSLVAHCMGITTPDPLDLDLYFERFLNPARSTPPDIDTDFCSRRRDDVIHHLFETYGEDQVAMVGTVNTYRPRSALGDVAKAHGIAAKEVRLLTSTLFHRYYHPSTDLALTEGKEESPYAELIDQYSNNPRYSLVFQQATALLGLPHHLSVHPGGVVIAPGPIVDFAPITRSGGKGVTITQFDLGDVEQVGLVKLDLLGIRGLTVLGDVADHIFSWRRTEFQNVREVLEGIEQDDPETSALLVTGQTIGCFQIESPGMRATLKDIQAKSPQDLMAALALYRPGPLKGGLRDAFVRRHKHEEEVTHIHPALSGLLHDTYGVILYQEQVLRIAHQLAGFSLAEADLLRRAMSHFDPGNQMQVLRDKFIVGAEKQNDIPPEIGLHIWEMMAAFAGYGFPKAHAASYAHVAWQSAWCKAHYPAEFLAAVLANWGGYYPQSVYLNEARRLKIKVCAPHVNHSQKQFSTSYPNGIPILYMGLDQVHNLTQKTQEKIIHYRPFHSLTEFMMKVNPRKAEVENLVMVGAFDGIGTIPGLLLEIKESTNQPGQLSLFTKAFSGLDDWSLEQKNTAQQKILNACLAAHPLELLSEKIRESGAINTIEASSRSGQIVRVAGMRQTLFRSRTAKNEWMGFLSLEDLDGLLDVVLFPDLFRKARNLLSDRTAPLLIEGVMDRDEHTGDPILKAQIVSQLK